MPLLIHIAESSVVAALISLAVVSMRKLRFSAAAVHGLWLIAFAKFAIPFSLLWSAGSWFSSLLPEQPVFQTAAPHISNLLADVTKTNVAPALPVHSWIYLVAVGLWIGGAVFFVGRWTSRLQHSATLLNAAPIEILECFLGAKSRLNVQRAVRVAISESVTEPMLRGIRRPVVILPESLAGNLSQKELDAVFIHELAHAQREDNLSSSMAHLIRCVFWFYPLLWWMERQLSIECEYACDEVVLSILQSPTDYISGIAKATRVALSGAIAGFSGIGGFEFKNRLELIMSYAQNSVRQRSGRGFIVAAAAAVLLLPIAGGFTAHSLLYGQTVERRRGIEFVNATASGNSPQSLQILAALKVLLNPNDTVYPSTGNTRWDNWLNKEVVYLITPEERAAFIALSSDGQREDFVNQFWEKRNPEPGTAVNKFKEEQYRRLAFATRHFAAADLEGWQTDRGRTYIMFGPPDEIDSHPDQNREMWGYNVRGTADKISVNFDISDRQKS